MQQVKLLAQHVKQDTIVHQEQDTHVVLELILQQVQVLVQLALRDTNVLLYLIKFNALVHIINQTQVKAIV